VAGEIVHLQFEVIDGSLYLFWLSASRCGESRGWLAGGGPEAKNGRDSNGSCSAGRS
jgi:hypothetical protein